MSPTAATAARRVEQSSLMATGKTSLKTVSGSRFKPTILKRMSELLKERVPHYDYLEDGLRLVPDTGSGLVLQVCAPYLAELVKPHHDIIQAAAKEVMGGRTVAVNIVISGDAFPRDRIGGLIKPHHELIHRRIEELVADAGEYDAWLRETSFAADTVGGVTVYAPTAMIADFCKQKHAPTLASALGILFGQGFELQFQATPNPTNVIHYDPALRKRIQENGGYQGDTNIARATDTAIREGQAKDTDRAVTRQKSGFRGGIYFMASSKFVTEILDKLQGKPRRALAIECLFLILAHLDMETFKSPLRPVDLSRMTGQALPNVSTSLRVLEEVGAIILVRKGTRISAIYVQPHDAYRGGAHTQQRTQRQFELELEKIEKGS